MEAKSKIITLDPEREIMPCEPDIYAGLVSALKLIKQHTNGHLVEVSMETHKIFSGGWKRRLVAQQIEFNVKITVEKEEQK
jgi:hypothetical protein